MRRCPAHTWCFATRSFALFPGLVCVARSPDAGVHLLTRLNALVCVRQRRPTAFSLYAPDGEFTMATYRITSPFPPPILVTPFLEVQVSRRSPGIALFCLSIGIPGLDPS